MIIGIGGISNAGKSWLAEQIKARYFDRSVKILCQDDFAMPTSAIPKIKGHTDWEVPESIDFDRFYDQIMSDIARYDIVIEEGLFVFYEERLSRLYDKSIFMRISKETFVERKKKDLRWGKEPDWYIEHIWDSHQEFCKQISHRNTAFQISGEYPVDLKAVFNYLES